ncbi:hypothetical protein [Pseudomonas sp. CC6-YY-74]|uniref:hypothetical protein n=1 Tax=Pseudomonas sp. CC6-YY-74 TaxID=1930532 RepID=UPI0009A16DDA|nr:hypothetical protein [Pseudomonas sp. CC6-YY-74]
MPSADSIFQNPLCGNIHWCEVESLLHHLGATLEPILAARFRVPLNQHEFILRRPHHQRNVYSKQDIKPLRDCLTRPVLMTCSPAEPGRSSG